MRSYFFWVPAFLLASCSGNSFVGSGSADAKKSVQQPVPSPVVETQSSNAMPSPTPVPEAGTPSATPTPPVELQSDGSSTAAAGPKDAKNETPWRMQVELTKGGAGKWGLYLSERDPGPGKKGLFQKMFDYVHATIPADYDAAKCNASFRNGAPAIWSARFIFNFPITVNGQAGKFAIGDGTFGVIFTDVPVAGCARFAPRPYAAALDEYYATNPVIAAGWYQVRRDELGY